MLRKSIKLIFVLTAMTLFLTPAWGSIPDATNVEDQALTFFRNHEVAGTCVRGEFLDIQPILARGRGSGGGSGGGSGRGSYSGTCGTNGGFVNNNGSHRMGSQGTNAAQQNQHEYQYQQQKTTKRQNQHQYQQQQQKTEKQNQHQYQYQHREESGAQN
jgi:hypothetical protein